MQIAQIDELFASARRFLTQGQFQAAESHCAQILGQDGSHHDALHLLGIIHLRTGRPDSGLAYVDRALSVRPHDPHVLNSRGNALLERGLPLAALDAFDTALRLMPAMGIVHSNRSNALIALNRPAEALAAADRGIALSPSYPPAHNNRGSALLALELPADALASLDQALSLDGRFVEAWTNRGNALLSLHQPQEALASFEKALQFNPGFFKARTNLCQALIALNRPEEALAACDLVLSQYPNDAKTLLNRSSALLALGRASEAAVLALEFLEQALTQVPDHPDLLSMLGSVQLRVGRDPDAVKTYRRLLELDPDYHYAIGGLLQARAQECDWSDHEQIVEQAVQGVRAGHRTLMPFAFLNLPSTPADQLLCARAHAKESMPPGVAPRPLASARNGKIRIAYVSGDFREHPVANQIVGLLETHDRSRFEIVGVATESADDSAVARRIRECWDTYLDVPRLDPAGTARLLQQHGVTIAVDLSGSTLGNRMPMYAHRAAPIQVNFLGYPGSAGSRCHDYIIADPVVIPPEHQSWYDEKIAWLPHSYQPFDSRESPPLCTATRGEEQLPEGAFVYCCFNNRFKLNPRMFGMWMRVLGKVQGSVLWLTSCPERVQDRLRAEAALRGVDPQRLIFARRKDSRREHVARYQLADLFLDTLPFNAHATASDALWAGLPVLTCLGESFPGRVAAGMVQAAGLPELITGDLGQYEARAISLAAPDSPLQMLRSRLMEGRIFQPLFDLGAYRLDLETAYDRMVSDYRAGREPESFTVSR